MKYILLYAICSGALSAVFGQTVESDVNAPWEFISVCADKEDQINEPIHLDWVELDKHLINQLNALPEKASTIEKIKTILPGFLNGKCNCNSVTHELGYSLKSTQHTIHGGYGSCTVDALYYKESVIKIRLTVQNHKEIIEKYLKELMKLFDCVNGQISYEKVYEHNLEKYKTEVGDLFIGSTDSTYRRMQAINYFTDIYTGGIFQTPYYITFGLGSDTFNNLRYFIVNRDYDALQKILICPSPTSRLFAAKTLFYMSERFDYRPSQEIERRMSNELKNPQPIRSGVLSCWINKFDYDYFDIVKNFETYLFTE